MQKLITAALILFLSCSITSAAWAQPVNQSQKSFKRSAATVIFASLGGGVLGLSTLSFYGKPQEHTDNITTGVAVGLIAGLIYIFSDMGEQRYNEVRQPWIPEFHSGKEQNHAQELFPSLAVKFDF